MSDRETRKRIERIEELLRQLETIGDPKTKAGAIELLQTLMDLHGDCLSRIVTVLNDQGDAGREILAMLAADESICGLFLLYGLHPVSVKDRVAGAIDELQPLLASHHASVEVVSIANGTVHLKLTANGGGCQSNPGQLKQLIEDTVIGAAPDLAALTIEEAAREPQTVFVPLRGLSRSKPGEQAQQVAVL